MTTDIRYLVFSGGGPAGVAFAGSFQGLAEEPSFSLKNIKGVAGTSVGSIAALIVSLNYTPQQAEAKLSNLELNKLKDGGCFINQGYRLFNQYGIYEGQALYAFILSLLKEKCRRNDPENITFADLKKLGFKDLYVITTKLYLENGSPTGKQKIFSYEKTPNTAVAATILASTAVPVFFSRVRFKKVEKGKYVLDEKGDLYNDGGILNNFPIDIFDSPKYMDLPDQANVKIVNPHTLGFALRKTTEIVDADHKTVKTVIPDGHPIEYTTGLVNSFLRQYQKQKLDDKLNRERTIQIDRLDVGLSKFSLDEKTKKALIDSGKRAVKAYFAQRPQAPMPPKHISQIFINPIKRVFSASMWQRKHREDHESRRDSLVIPRAISCQR